MSDQPKVTCAGCGRDFGMTRPNAVIYYADDATPERIECRQFCGLKCLAKWLASVIGPPKEDNTP